MNITDNNNTYVIKLDELDLNYFYLNFPPETTSPLWNLKNTNLGNYDYCQFKVEAVEISDSKSTTCLQTTNNPNDASNINLSTYNCLLCNVNIPIVYRSEHKNSPKHKICIKIAQIALERSKNLITFTDEGSSSKVTSNTIFCEPCAIAVNVTDKKKHDLSKTHQKSLLHDRYLNDLFMIYKDSVYLDSVKLKFLENYNDAAGAEEAMTVTEGALSVSRDSMTVTEGALSVTEDALSVIEDAECSADSDNISNLNDSEDDINELEKNTALKQEKLKVSINGTNIPKHKWLFIGQDDICIETADKCILEVSFDNYHGFHTKDGQTQCRVCQVSVYTEKQVHILSSEHVARINTPLENMHCLRKIDATYNYCVICNEIFTYAEPHKYMETHLAAVKKAIGMYTPLVRTEQTQLHKPSIQNNEPKLSSSTATPSIEPKLTSTTKAPPIIVEPKLTLTKTTTPNNELKPTKQIVEQKYCQACKIYIDLHNFRSHASGWMHKANLEMFEKEAKPAETQPQNVASTSKIPNNSGNSNTLASANKVDKATTIDATATAASTRGKTYCKPCRIYIYTHNFNSHSLGRNHKMNLNLFENKKNNNNKFREKSVAAASKHNNFLLSNNPNINYCKPCQIYIHINDSQSHTSGKNHKMNLDVLQNQNTADTPKDSTSSAQTKTQMSNTDKIKKETPSNDTTVQNEPKERKQIKLHYLMQYTENDIVKCKVCDVQVPTYENNIQEHIQGRNHCNKYSSLLKSNNIKKKERDLYCEICDVNIGIFNELRHIERHNKDAKMYSYCEYCNVFVNIADKQRHESGSRHESAVLSDKLKNELDEWTQPYISTNGHSRAWYYEKRVTSLC